MSPIFYLGTHMTHWLESVNVPLFISRRRLSKRRMLPRSRASWALDSGGFSELSMHGLWTVTAAEYAAEVERFYTDVGHMEWAAIQDWMCEPFILKKTGLTVLEHQRRTIDSLKRLTDLSPHMPWVPVLQGFTLREYLNHVEMYAQAGIELSGYPVVGVGSICRRQGTAEAESILKRLAGGGLKLHGFGFKMLGLSRVADVLHSADSMAWSFAARHDRPIHGHSHKNCANCEEYALLWRARVLAQVETRAENKRIAGQLELWPFAC